MNTRVAVAACVACMACIASAACSPANPGVADADSSADAPFVPAPHDVAPPIPLNGGAALASASIVVVTFAGDALAAQIEDYADWIASSKWLAAVGSEYGIGTPSIAAKVRLAQAAPAFASSADFTAYVASRVGIDLPAANTSANSGSLYVFVLPSGATFADPTIGALCNQFTGYHDADAQRAYAFALVGDCPKHVPGLTDFEQVERVLSHELIEALTNPFGDGWAARDPNNPWTWVSGGEVADVCNGYAHEQGFLAERSWSNAAAAAGLDPCQPNDVPLPYFNLSAPVAQVQVAAGGQTTLTLQAWSGAPVADWVVQPAAGPAQFAPQAALSPTTVNNGASTQLTITVPPDAAPGTHGVVLLRSMHPGDATYSLLPIAVRAL